MAVEYQYVSGQLLSHTRVIDLTVVDPNYDPTWIIINSPQVGERVRLDHSEVLEDGRLLSEGRQSDPEYFTYQYNDEGAVREIVHSRDVFVAGTHTANMFSESHFVWDAHGRLLSVYDQATKTMEGPNQSGGFQDTAGYRQYFDPLGRVAVVVAKRESTGASVANPIDSATYYVYDRTGGSIEIDVETEKVVGSVLANVATGLAIVVDRSLPGEGTESVWYFEDIYGSSTTQSVVDAAGNWTIYHTDFDQDGVAEITLRTTQNWAMEATPTFWQGKRLDQIGRFYQLGSTALDPLRGRTLSQISGPSGGYGYANSDPVNRSMVLGRMHISQSSGSEPDAYGTGIWSAPDAYGTGIWGGWKRLVGEGVRGILPDEYLLSASDGELTGLTVGVTIAGVLSGGAAFGAASAAGVGTLGAGAIAGAVGGGVEYVGWVVGSNTLSRLDGRDDGASFDASQFGSHVVFGGAFGFGGSLAGKGIGAGARHLLHGAKNASQAVRNAAGRQFVHGVKNASQAVRNASGTIDVAPNRVAASEGLRVPGAEYLTRSGASKLDALERRLSGWGIRLERNADEVLDEIGLLTGTTRRAQFEGFADGTGILSVRAGATRYEVLHELSHVLDFRKNPTQWIRAGSTDAMSTALRETAVFNRLRGSKSWWKLNFQEQLDSLRYVQRIRDALNLPGTAPWSNPFN